MFEIADRTLRRIDSHHTPAEFWLVGASTDCALDECAVIRVADFARVERQQLRVKGNGEGAAHWVV